MAKVKMAKTNQFENAKLFCHLIWIIFFFPILAIIIYIFSHFDFCHNRRNSFWTSWASLSFLRQTKHTFCHLKQTDNCTASFSSQLKKYWIGIFLDAKLHMYASKYNVHSGQKNCQLRKIIKSMAILFFTTIIVTIYNQGLQYTT